MRRKQIEKVQPKAPDRMGGRTLGRRVTAQLSGRCLVLDLWADGTWIHRHVTDTETGEYASYGMDGQWTAENLANAFVNDIWSLLSEEGLPISKGDRELALGAIKVDWPSDLYERVASLEREYARGRRDRKEQRRGQRIRELMESVPSPGKAVYDWIEEKAAGGLHYAIWEKGPGDFSCTSCGGIFTEAEAGARMKHRGEAACPLCGQLLRVEKRRRGIRLETRLTLVHGLDGKRGIQRHFVVSVYWERGLFRTVRLHETIRCMLHKGPWSRHLCDIYYMQAGEWDNKGNPCNLRWKPGYLYPEGIQEGLEGTAYQGWADVFRYMASMGMRANYDRLLADRREEFIGMVEYLAKGRFRRLLEETSEQVDFDHGYGSYNALDVFGEDICEVMYIWDMQKIIRLRQEDGGVNMLEWLQWADAEKKRIRSDVLAWYGRNGISNGQYGSSRASRHLSPEQLMHYIERQVKESYGGKRKAGSVFETYKDYLSMSERLGKDMSDAMVYRPRELKRRHGEAVEEHSRHMEAERARKDAEQARKDAERMEEKYPGSGAVLAQIRPKYEYEGERFRIMVPGSFCDIVLEGMALHHCVGGTERYFDRILQHETYICFLRRMEEPDRPFYTIEVEPGGTIRQHRGMYDGEPDIEEVKPFLREWQKEIRKRMKEEDHEHARLSAVKREQNMEELRQKNNTRVLEALMEDLMEVV